MTVTEAERCEDIVSRPERALSNFERIHELPEYFLTLPQIRKSLNRTVIDSMKDSLRNGGDLDSPISVSRIEDPAVLQSWLDLIHRARGVEIAIADCSPFYRDGSWYLVTSGHHRWQAVWELNQETLESDDLARELLLLGADIRRASSIEEIFAQQKNGNNHSVPTKEDEASFTVMHWVNGRDAGKWTTKAEFLRQNKEVSRGSLDDALHFADLPKAIQDFVWTGQLRYSISVQVGRAYPAYVDYIMARIGDTITPDNEDDFNIALQMEMGILINKLLGHGTNAGKPMSVDNAKKFITQQIKGKESMASKYRGIEAEEGPEGLFPEGVLYSTDDQYRAYLQDLREQWDKARKDMYQASVEKAEACEDMMCALKERGTPPPDHIMQGVADELGRRRARVFGATVASRVGLRVG